MIPGENLNSVKGLNSTGTGKYMGKNKSDYSSLYLQRSPEKTTHSIAQDCLKFPTDPCASSAPFKGKFVNDWEIMTYTDTIPNQRK